jgi:hypothetical protein
LATRGAQQPPIVRHGTPIAGLRQARDLRHPMGNLHLSSVRINVAKDNIETFYGRSACQARLWRLT